MLFTLCLCLTVFEVFLNTASGQRNSGSKAGPDDEQALFAEGPLNRESSKLPPNAGGNAAADDDTRCLSPSYSSRDVGLERRRHDAGEAAANSTGVEGWMWTEETFEEKKRRLSRGKADDIAGTGENAVDFVYKFVDSSRGAHASRKRYWESRLRTLHATRPDAVRCPAIDDQQNSVRRERNNHELLYALRSLHAYAPWFRHVFVVVEGPHMVPTWLNSSYERLTVVYHADIFPEPKDLYLPTFNGHAVASVLHRIPCLSDHYVAMDDDFFFTSSVRPEDFFETDESGTINGIRGIHAGGTIKVESSERCQPQHHHLACNMNSAYMWNEFLSRFEMKNLAREVPEFRMMEHAPYASAKRAESFLFDEVFAAEISELRTHRFRSKADFHVQALAFNIARAAKVVGASIPELCSAGLSGMKTSFQSFKSENAVENVNKIRAAARECQFIGINDDMGDEVGEEVLANIVHFYDSTWPLPAPWETARSENASRDARFAV